MNHEPVTDKIIYAIKKNCMHPAKTEPDKGRGSGPSPQPYPHPLEIHNLLFVSLEILVRTPLEKRGPIASRERSVRPSMKYVDDYKQTKT